MIIKHAFLVRAEQIHLLTYASKWKRRFIVTGPQTAAISRTISRVATSGNSNKTEYSNKKRHGTCHYCHHPGSIKGDLNNTSRHSPTVSPLQYVQVLRTSAYSNCKHAFITARTIITSTIVNNSQFSKTFHPVP